MNAAEVQGRAELRRRQVVNAAAECFRRNGFHGTSIAHISKVAGMSSGHIYHYFANKELIVEAIVAQEESDFAELLRALHSACSGAGLLEVLDGQLETILERILDPQRIGLMLEIAAEAARNPRIALMLQVSDQRMRRSFAELAAARGETAVAHVDTTDGRTRLEMLPVLFSGLALRSIYNPDTDRALMARLLKQTLTHLWRAPA